MQATIAAPRWLTSARREVTKCAVASQWCRSIGVEHANAATQAAATTCVEVAIVVVAVIVVVDVVVVAIGTTPRVRVEPFRSTPLRRDSSPKWPPEAQTTQRQGRH